MTESTNKVELSVLNATFNKNFIYILSLLTQLIFICVEETSVPVDNYEYATSLRQTLSYKISPLLNFKVT